ERQHHNRRIRGTFATIVPSSRHVTDPSLPMASLGCGGALIRAHTGPVLRYRFVTFVVSWNRGSTCSMSLLRILGIKHSCWFATGLHAPNRAVDRRGCRLGRLCATQIRQPPGATAPAAEELIAYEYSYRGKVSDRDHSSKRTPRRGRAPHWLLPGRHSTRRR